MIRIWAIATAMVAGLISAAAQEPPASAGPVPPALIDDLVVANRILSDRGILDAFGHISVRHPENPTRYLMARAIAPGIVTAADIMEFDLDSNPVDRRGRSMFIERFIHGEVYKVRPDVGSVIHTHSMGGSRSASPRRRCSRSSTMPRFCMWACRCGKSARLAA